MPVKVKWLDEPQGNVGDLAYYEPIDDHSKDLRNK